ncbi:ABC transporter substrate-binding protein [Marivibrio halodurans]|uniref:ABC transporter substrate-binding protein n=1 Tax=Marivibrio halodurans TaxID=2039722 RepID=A0A8J7RX45_9PROT|nr:ABC transporter substrate-binding protein [Marivibrio halodurans]MBP5856030.1 ABC transporter substrate-binding protein [Marivibrio halodurans]
MLTLVRSSLTRSILAGLAIAMAMSLTLGLEARAATDTERSAARARVESLGADLARLSERAPTLSNEEAVKAGAEIVRENFDLPAIAAATVGHGVYEKWTPDQREEYVDVFIRYTIASQSDALTMYEGDKLEITGVEDAPSDLVMVRTRYEGDSGEPSSVDFMLSNDSGDGYKIVDLIVDGSVSQLKLRRAEFSSVLKSKGYEGLIEILRDKADQLMARND